jgi:predicted transcriptional regulator
MTKEKLFELFITQDLSQRSVAKSLNCSQATVRYFLKKYNIIKRKSDRSVKDSDSFAECSKCNKVKPSSDFYLRKTTKDELATTSWCKMCNSKSVVSTQKKSKSILVALKGGSCQVCSFDEYEGALEFHHIDPATKDDKLSKLTRSKLSKEIIDEINKCVLVCSVCHKMIHAGLRTCPSPAIISYDVLK